MKITILGSGTSHGIPVVGCACPVCSSGDPRDNRMRASLLVEGRAGETLIIDTGPEFRLQAIRAGLRRLDGVFLTHAHADHLHGLDDVRPLSREQPLPVYGSGSTIEELRERFSYVFRESQRGGGKPRLAPRAAAGPVGIGNLTLTPIPVKHGALDIYGWKIEERGNPRITLYLTDCSFIPPESLSLAGSPEILVIGGLRRRPHETHFNFDEALETALRLGARHTRLTHICHDHFHREIEAYCRDFMEKAGFPASPGQKKDAPAVSMAPAYDGLTIERN
jgi:phosphoribosyl 1,2-cyclic phosphate phosphodiesterase